MSQTTSLVPSMMQTPVFAVPALLITRVDVGANGDHGSAGTGPGGVCGPDEDDIHIGSAVRHGVGRIKGPDNLTCTGGLPRPLYQPLDRLQTPLREGDDRLEFLITDLYEDGTYGGSLLRAGDPSGLPFAYYEDVGMSDFVAWGWTLANAPGLESGAARPRADSCPECQPPRHS